MKNIIFTVKTIERTLIPNMINGIKVYSGNCRIDFLANKIYIDVAKEDKIDDIINFISQNCTILRIDISKSSVEDVGKPILSFLEDGEFVLNNVRHNSVKAKNSLDKLCKVINLAFSSTGRISEEEICSYLDTCKQEMILGYNPYLKVGNVNAGDIVLVNYGMHPKGEICGNIISVVCDAYDDMVCVVPIVKAENNLSQNCLFEKDRCVFTNKAVGTGTLRFDMTKYIRIERIQCVFGKVFDDYLKEIKSKLAKTFDFLN